jgi:hypothetical protein
VYFVDIITIAKHLIIKKKIQKTWFRMCKKYILQRSIFEFYCEHESGQQLKAISAKLDEHPTILDLASEALISPGTKSTGRCGLSVDSIVRAALLKQLWA